MLSGCDAPMLLRKVEDGTAGVKRWKLAGECLVYGVVDGDAVQEMQVGWAGAREFDIL